MSLGELEQVVLFAVVRLGGETHGAPVVEEIEQRTDELSSTPGSAERRFNSTVCAWPLGCGDPAVPKHITGPVMVGISLVKHSDLRR